MVYYALMHTQNLPPRGRWPAIRRVGRGMAMQSDMECTWKRCFVVRNAAMLTGCLENSHISPFLFSLATLDS